MSERHPGHDNSSRYNLQYRVWHDDNPKYAADRAVYLREQLQPFLPAPGPLSILDVGCGMGFVLLTLREMGFTNLYGIDVDPDQVKSCQRFVLPVEQVTDPFSFLQTHQDQFDVVLMIDVLEHIPAEEQICFMRGVYRSMRAGGRVIVQVPNAGSILGCWQRYIDFTHWTSFTPVSLAFVLENAGFEKIQIPGQGRLRRPPLSLWTRWARGEFRKWLIRYLWRQVLSVELGNWARIDDLPVELNMIAVAFKPDPNKDEPCQGSPASTYSIHL